jgi:hypothetical protein
VCVFLWPPLLVVDGISKVTADEEKDGQPRRRGEQRPIELEDVSFHSCVRLTEFETDKTIS